MGWQPTAFSLPPLVAGCISTFLVWDTWDSRHDSLGRPFVGLVAAIAGWSFAYAIQLGFTTADEQLLWLNVGTSFGVTIPPLWIVLTSRYAGKDDWLTEWRVLALGLEPAVVVTLLWTNRTHGLVWRDIVLATGQPSIDPAFGLAYVVHIAYAYLLVGVGIALLLSTFVRATTYRLQAGLLAVGAIVPLGANAAFVLGINPIPGLDLTTFSFTVTGAVFGLALFRFDLLNLQPVARERALDDLGNGLVVVGPDGDVADLNPVARDVLPDGASAGDPATEVLPGETVDDCEGRVLEVDRSNGRHFYECRVSGLSDHRDQEVGTVVALRDVTDRREYEQRLEVANRLLRHNLRNDMTKILGWADIAGERGDDGVREATEQIESVAERVADLGRKAKRIEQTLDAEAERLVDIDAVAVLSAVVEDARNEWPEANVALGAPETATVRAPSDELLESAVRNVVENALEHNDAESPTVDISVTADEEWVTVRVADDGPGIPEMERQTLTEGTETALNHGSGLGLWLVTWIVRGAGGELQFEDNDPEGSVVVLRFRPGDRE